MLDLESLERIETDQKYAPLKGGIESILKTSDDCSLLKSVQREVQ